MAEANLTNLLCIIKQMTSALLLLAFAQPKDITIRLPEAPSVVRWVDSGKKLILVSSRSLSEWPSGRTLLIPSIVESDYGASRTEGAIFNADGTLMAYPLDSHNAAVVDLKKWSATTVKTYSYQIAFKGRELVSMDYVGDNDSAVIRSKSGDELLPNGYFFAGINPLCNLVFTVRGTSERSRVIAFSRNSKGTWTKFAESSNVLGEYVSESWYALHEPSKTVAYTSFWDTGATLAAIGIMRPGWQGKIFREANDRIGEAIQPPRWLGDSLLLARRSWSYEAETGPYDIWATVNLYDLNGNVKRLLFKSQEIRSRDNWLRSADYDPKTGRLALSIGSDSSGKVIIRKV